MGADDKTLEELNSSSSSSESWKERILFPTLLAGIAGGGVGLISKHGKVHGVANISASYGANFAIVTGCYCGIVIGNLYRLVEYVMTKRELLSSIRRVKEASSMESETVSDKVYTKGRCRSIFYKGFGSWQWRHLREYPLILVSHTLLSERNFGVKSYWDTLCSMVKRSVSIPDRKLFNSNMSGFKDIGSRYWMPSPSTQGDWFVMGIGVVRGNPRRWRALQWPGITGGGEEEIKASLERERGWQPQEYWSPSKLLDRWLVLLNSVRSDISPSAVCGLSAGGEQRVVVIVVNGGGNGWGNWVVEGRGAAGAREFVRASRASKPDDLLNSAIAGLGSGAILGRLQG
ncbi:hypothetical protein TEA_009239 [Camellia sinensis var. sinensis]|uniref:Uncharacterized protein n=1 Tax=Camellia sinensis var. sinensis TaxID=542762 RepID=A0A4S4D4J4_CAMSN|nr:hypothetical protein TEA_009239 [Camellia sinensis var. sinensis]